MRTLIPLLPKNRHTRSRPAGAGSVIYSSPRESSAGERAAASVVDRNREKGDLMFVSSRLVIGLAVLACLLVAAGGAGGAGAASQSAVATPDLGPNVKIIDSSMSTAQIKAIVDPIAAAQVSNQFGTRRAACFCMPGSNGSRADPLNFQVGYYTEVAGLGQSPGDASVRGTIDVHNQCFGPGDCTALVNFWRSLSNLTIHIDTSKKIDCDAAGEFWATSQAAPMRRVQIDNGFFTLMDF